MTQSQARNRYMDMVVTAFPSASAAGAEILRAGGNAVDAAVASAFALAVCEPGGSGLGGQATILVHFPDGRNVILDGHSYAPAAVSLKTVSEEQQSKGYRACVIPSMVATMEGIHRRYGRLPWERLLEPAVRLADEGFLITPLQNRQLTWCLAGLQDSPVASNLFLDRGKPFDAGTLFRQAHLANTLRRLAKHGAEDFYCGGIAQAIAEDMKQHDGLLTADDLANCRLPIEREPVSSTYRGYDVITAPPPGGGLLILLGLGILECLNDELTSDENRWYEILAETTYTVFREREDRSLHPRDFTHDRRTGYLQRERIQALAANVRNHSSASALQSVDESGGETTHLCTADQQGCIVALTQSLQSLYGARVANAECGFLYNNYLRTCPREPHPHQLGPGSWPRSNAVPTIILKHSTNAAGKSAAAKLFLTLGSAGSRRIISSMLQIISRVIDRGLTIDQAMHAPRIHGMLNREIWLEQPAATEELCQRLGRLFQHVRVRIPHSYAMAAVQAIQFLDDGSMLGSADPRRDGAAAGL